MCFPVLFAAGCYQLYLRSLCCFVNDTDLLLEVAILEDQDSGYTVIPHMSTGGSTSSQSLSAISSSSSRGNLPPVGPGRKSPLPLGPGGSSSFSSGGFGDASGGTVGETAEEQMFEYERYIPLRGWSYTHLLPSDPKRYSRLATGGRSSDELPKIMLPQVGVLSGFSGGKLRVGTFGMEGME
jgi:hypothetical protein